MNKSYETGRHGGWPLSLFGVACALLGLALAGGGGWLLALGGSWYYLVAGLGLLVSGVLLARGRYAGALWFAATFVLSLGWAWWESGADYWRWVPRMGLMVFLGLVLALLLPRLDRPVSRGMSRGLAGALALVFVVAFALAFVPYGVTEADGALAHVASLAAAVTTPRAGAQPADAPADADWAAYGRDNAGSRYTPLRQITPGNVATLQTAWTFRTGDLPGKRWGAETTPIKIGDSLYLCTARNQLLALDAGTGRERWRYDPKVSDQAIPYTAACRGVTYYQLPEAANAEAAAQGAGPVAGPVAVAARDAACRTRIIEGTLDGRLIAVDAASGKPCEGFGEHGQVDITVGMGDTPPGYVSINSPPTIVRGVIVTGHQVLDGQKRYEPSGVIQGFDAVTGQLRWPGT